MKRIQHKIRGSQPGYIGIELPNDYSVMLLDEENFNAFRQHTKFNGLQIDVKDSYCHFRKPTEGSWHVIVEGNTNFSPENIHIIYKAA